MRWGLVLALSGGAAVSSPAKSTKILRCKFCAWTRPLFWTSKTGKKRSGWVALVTHMADEHLDELIEIRRRVRAS